MSRRDIANQLGMARGLQALASAWRDELNSVAADEFEPGDRLTAKLPDGTSLGRVNHKEGSVSSTVTDEAALLAYVEREHPSEVQTIRKVRDGFRAKLLDAAKAHGGLLNEETGETAPIPGVQVTHKDPQTAVTLSDDATRALYRAIRSGQVLALPAPADEGGE